MVKLKFFKILHTLYKAATEEIDQNYILHSFGTRISDCYACTLSACTVDGGSKSYNMLLPLIEIHYLTYLKKMNYHC